MTPPTRRHGSRRRLFLAATVLTGIVLGGVETAAAPLKVFILAGQSNMEGHARVTTFDYIGMDPATAPMLRDMRQADGTPRVCDNVWISYLTGNGDEYHGTLTAGYGAKGREPKIGPEFTFGIYVQKLLGEPVLLIKTAWGGKSINTDFRPPSAGPYQLPEEQLEQFRKRGVDLEQWYAERAKATGHYYRLMVDHVHKVLADIERVYPDYSAEEGYEIAGFIWFQGWNDMCDGTTYPKRNEPGGYDLYGDLLAHFIRDVRREFSTPQMPFVIGVLGVDGFSDNKKHFRDAMAVPARMPEFRGTVAAVQTAEFWDPALVAASKKKGEFNRILDTAHQLGEDGQLNRDEQPYPGWRAVGTPPPEERVWRYTAFNAAEAEEQLDRGVTKRFRDVTLPDGWDGWAAPGFDDNGWKRGTAPIGTGEWKHRGTAVRNNADWGDGEFLLMRTSFDLESLDYEAFRLSVMSRQGFRIFLNGHEIHTYIWWKNQPYYRAIVLGEEQVRHLKVGTNVLAAYANIHYDRRTEEPYNSIDLSIEGITREGQTQLAAALEKVFPAADRRVAAGASNAGYHYMGSGKMMAQIGRAFAEAVIKLRQQ